jgi:DNA-binding NarL/FixJ family response regulator
MLKGLAAIFIENKQFEIAGCAEDSMELLELIKVRVPDVILLDSELKKIKSRQLISRIAAKHPSVKLVVHALHEELEVNDYLDLGAHCVVSKKRSVELPQIILQTFHGSSSDDVGNLNNKLERLNGHNIQSDEHLSHSELRIVIELCSGLSGTKVAKKLNLSPHTVHTHLSRIYRKLNIHSRHELMNYAKDRGLIS